MIDEEFTARLLLSQYYSGLNDGIRRYAYWEEGKQWVGTSGVTLENALAKLKKEHDRDFADLTYKYRNTP